MVKTVYEATAHFPRDELYGLTSQMRRAAVSVPSNIAEGAARFGVREFLQFLSIARGSLSELETQIIIANQLGLIEESEDLLAQLERVFALLGGLIVSLKNKTSH